MKKLVLLAIGLFAATMVMAMPNPAALYCERMGYEYKIAADGARGVVVVAPGVEFDAWDFFKGKVGREHSFATLSGYDIECVRTNIGSYVREDPVCYPKGACRQSAGAITLLELMRLRGMPLHDPARSGKRSRRDAFIRANQDEDIFKIYELMDGSRTLPSSFDWRDYNGRAYIGAVRDQGACGSCYAFAAAAAAEGTYNWAVQKYDSDCADFSESFIIWCLGRKPEYYNHFYGCKGADYDYYELTALIVEGVCRESAFPYTVNNPGSCTHWSDPTVVFSSWSRIPCNDIEAIKTAIITYGVVDAAVDMDAGFTSYSSGVYENSSTTCPGAPCYYTITDHAISLVGWDDNPPEGGGGCWILRNSWGTAWGEGGYMRIRYTSARVACAACYLTYPQSSTRSLTVASAHGGANPPVGVHTYNNGATISCGITNSFVVDGTNRYICTGWIGAGSVPASGYGTDTGPLALNANSTIVWLWELWETNSLPAPAFIFAGTGGTGDNIAVVWSAVAGATGYQLWRGVSNNPSTAALLTSTGAELCWSDGSALVGQLYYYWVKAGNAALTSTFSAYATGWRAGFSAGAGVDYDGDGLADPAIYTESSGVWRIKPSSHGYATSAHSFNGLGGRGHASMTADYDGDGLADPAVYNELSGLWQVLLSSSQYTITATLQDFGENGYSGVPADYDGDGLADPAVYGRSSGNWLVRLSTRNYNLIQQPGFLGGPGKTPVAADYDGDGFADPAVYDTATGVWTIKLSNSGYSSFTMPWVMGGTGWLPVPADYDGDGFADPAIRPTLGNIWLIRLSGSDYALTFVTLDF